LSHALPASVSHAVARKLRAKSTSSVARKDAFTMGIVDEEVERRLEEGFDAIVCGHVHQPQSRRVGRGELHVLGDWHGGGIYARASGAGIELVRFPA
jgi:UDP-2,3-diacylglucosamine pyrophosphatase LpxH